MGPALPRPGALRARCCLRFSRRSRVPRDTIPLLSSTVARANSAAQADPGRDSQALRRTGSPCGTSCPGGGNHEIQAAHGASSSRDRGLREFARTHVLGPRSTPDGLPRRALRGSSGSRLAALSDGQRRARVCVFLRPSYAFHEYCDNASLAFVNGFDVSIGSGRFPSDCMSAGSLMSGPSPKATLVCEPIGVIRTPFGDRVSAPRQARCATEVIATIELHPGKGFEFAVEDLDGWEYLWIVFWFHLNTDWRPKVLPPRSDRRRGSSRPGRRTDPIRSG